MLASTILIEGTKKGSWRCDYKRPVAVLKLNKPFLVLVKIFKISCHFDFIKPIRLIIKTELNSCAIIDTELKIGIIFTFIWQLT